MSKARARIARARQIGEPPARCAAIPSTVPKRNDTRLVFNGRLAEIAAEYLRKGSQIYVEGQIRTRKYNDKDGVEKYTTDIRVDQMQMLGSRQG